MTTRTTSSSLPRPRTKSAVFTSMAPSSSNIPPPTFKVTPPSALLASHNSNNRSLSRSPSFSIHGSPNSSPPTTSTASTSSSSTQRSVGGKLKKPSLGFRSASSSRSEEDKRKPLQRKISAPLFRDGEGREGSKEMISGISRPGRVEAQNSFLVHSTAIRSGSMRRKPAPVEEERDMSIPPRARTTSGPGSALSDSESMTGYQRKPPIPRQRVPSIVVAGPSRYASSSLPPQTTSAPVRTTPSSSRMQARASSPPSRTSVSSSSTPSNARAFTSHVRGTPSTSRIRTPSIGTKPTSSTSSAPSPPSSSQQPTPRTPAKSPARPIPTPTSPIPAPVTSPPPQTAWSAPSSVRRLSQVQGYSHSSSPYKSTMNTTSPAIPSLPSSGPEVRSQPVQQSPSTAPSNNTTSTTPASTRLRTPSLMGFSSTPKPGSTSVTSPTARRSRTTSTTTSTTTSVIGSASATTSPPTSVTVRGIRTRSIIPSMSSISVSVPGSTPAQPRVVTGTSTSTTHTSSPEMESSPHGSATSESTLSEFQVTTPRNEAFLFPRMDSGDESSGSVYSQASASASVSAVELQKGEDNDDEPYSVLSGGDLNMKVLEREREAVRRVERDLEQHTNRTPTSNSMYSKVTSNGDVQPKLSTSDSNAFSPFTSSKSSPSSNGPSSPSNSMASTVGGGGGLMVETRPLGSRTSNPSLRPVGPRNPLSSPKLPTSTPTPESTTGLAAVGTSPAPSGTLGPSSSQLSSLTVPPLTLTLTPNGSFGSLLSHYTTNLHGPTESFGSTVSSQSSSDYTSVSRRTAPAPNSIFGFGMFGSERSTDDEKGKGTRGRIPSFSDAVTESEKDDNERSESSDVRREKSMSVGTVRAVDVSESLIGRMMRDEDGRTVGDDPGGSRVVNLPPTSPGRPRIVSSPEPSPPSLSAPALSLSPHPRNSLQPTPSQTLSPLAESPKSLTHPHTSPKRHSFVPQRLGTDDMKRLLSKPAIVSPGHSSTSDSESYTNRSSRILPPPSSSSPRKRVASEQSHLRKEGGSRLTAQLTTTPPTKKLVVGESNWVAPWDVIHGQGAGQGDALLFPSLNRKASEDFLTWKREMSRENGHQKKSRNVLRKPSVRGLSTAAAAGMDPSVAAAGSASSSSFGLRPPPLGSQLKGRSSSPSTATTTSRSANSSSRGSSPTRGGVKVLSSLAVRTPAEEIMLAYKEQREREDKIEKTFGDEGVLREEESVKRSREGGGLQEGMVGSSSSSSQKGSTKPSPASTKKTDKREHRPSTAPQGRNQQSERTPPKPSCNPPESTTGQMVAIGSEKDAFLPSFWDNSTTNLASQLVIGNDDSRPPPTKKASGFAGRRSLQDRRSSLPRPITVSPPDLNSRISLDRSPAVVNSPSAPRSNHSSAGSTSIPTSPMSPGMKASKGGIWNLMKRISTGGLRDKYHQPGESDTSSPNTPPPPVPPLPKSLMPPSSKLKSQTAPIGSCTSNTVK
ncbi:hypothetical protein L218DRAFT_578855 [Marasmius fiardii PR-910]|nr:hypothetical protein L218DRAFT_578855 [Marasmius fiardii PR-910]